MESWGQNLGMIAKSPEWKLVGARRAFFEIAEYKLNFTHREEEWIRRQIMEIETQMGIGLFDVWITCIGGGKDVFDCGHINIKSRSSGAVQEFVNTFPGRVKFFTLERCSQEVSFQFLHVVDDILA